MQYAGEKTIAIVGAGVVGGALIAYLRGRGHSVRVFDPAKGYGDERVLDAAEIAFVCVPTPYTPGRGFDDSSIIDALNRLPGSKTVVLKSTVLPGMTDELQARYPRHRILFNPEFLREATAYQDLVRPDRQIVGCTRASSAAAAGVMAILPRAPFERICPAREAEMAKYAANAFLAIKVSYANEVFDLCERLGVAYDGVRDIVAADARIGGSHLDVNDGGYRGYAGKCLPKDTRSLLELAVSAGVHMDVLRSADRTNMRLRTPARPHPPAAEAGDDDAAGTAAHREQAA